MITSPFSSRATAARFPAYLALAAGLATAPLGAAPFAIDSVTSDSTSVDLGWSGGTPPYQVQYRSAATGGWSDLGDPVTGATANLPAPGDAVFYRVQSLGSADLGTHLGQIRVAEGEFKDAMAKHRAKLLLDFHEPTTSLPDRTPATYFRSLVARIQSLDGNRVHTVVGTLESLPDGAAQVTAKLLTFTWSTGEGDDLKEFTLTLDFNYAGYDANRPRSSAPHLSDPTYTLAIRHASPQVVVDFGGVSHTRNDEVYLYELEPRGDFSRNLTVRQDGVTMTTRFRIGRPVLQGDPAFIFKTPVLTHWERPTRLTGLISQPVELASRFSQTYHPGHHNFVETLFLEPALEPGIDPEILAELEAENIRVIIVENPTAFPELSPSIRILGFDDTLRAP